MHGQKTLPPLHRDKPRLRKNRIRKKSSPPLHPESMTTLPEKTKKSPSFPFARRNPCGRSGTHRRPDHPFPSNTVRTPVLPCFPSITDRLGKPSHRKACHARHRHTRPARHHGVQPAPQHAVAPPFPPQKTASRTARPGNLKNPHIIYGNFPVRGIFPVRDCPFHVKWQKFLCFVTRKAENTLSRGQALLSWRPFPTCQQHPQQVCRKT